MKTVLISIKEKWWKKILSGEKELEIRKNRPKGIEYPFRVVCYVTGRGIMGAFTCSSRNNCIWSYGCDWTRNHGRVYLRLYQEN